MLIDDNKIKQTADFFKVLSDPTRLKIIYALMNEELCVNDLSDRLNMNQSAISHQLKILKIHKLVKNKRDGKMILYSLDDIHIKEILHAGYEHMNEGEHYG